MSGGEGNAAEEHKFHIRHSPTSGTAWACGSSCGKQISMDMHKGGRCDCASASSSIGDDEKIERARSDYSDPCSKQNTTKKNHMYKWFLHIVNKIRRNFTPSWCHFAFLIDLCFK